MIDTKTYRTILVAGLAIGTFRPDSHAALAVTSGAIAYWNLDEVSGSTVHDSVGSNSGTAYSGVQLGVSGKSGTAFVFDGVNPGVSLANNIPSYGAGNMTFSAWVNYSSFATNRQNVVLGSWSEACSYLYVNETGKPVILLRNQSLETVNAIGSTALADGVWHYLTGVREGTTAKLYVDGVLNVSVTNPALVGAVSDPLYSPALFIGSYNSNRLTTPNESMFTGIIDDVAIYNRALSAAEIAQNYAAVPEPSALLLLAAAALTATMRRCREPQMQSVRR